MDVNDDDRISTDSVNNSQSVWITGVPETGRGAYHDGTLLPSQTALARAAEILR
jgi:hypothetical protein